MVSLLRFLFPINHEKRQQNRNNNNVLIIGKENENKIKTSLLYRMSENIVREECDDVLLIRPKAITSVPYRVEGMPVWSRSEGEMLSFVKTVYLTTYESLVDFLLSIESNGLSPTAIIIDEVSYYFKQCSQSQRLNNREPVNKRLKYQSNDEIQSLAQISALLVRVGNYCSQKRNGICYTIMSFNTTETFLVQHSKICQNVKTVGLRFFNHIWIFSQTLDSETESRYQIECDSRDSLLKVHFSHINHQILLKKITQKNK